MLAMLIDPQLWRVPNVGKGSVFLGCQAKNFAGYRSSPLRLVFAYARFVSWSDSFRSSLEPCQSVCDSGVKLSASEMFHDPSPGEIEKSQPKLIQLEARSRLKRKSSKNHYML